MMILETIQKKLESFASKEPWRDGYHQGIKGDDLSIELENGKLLMELAMKFKPRIVVEVGTGYGYSTSWIALGLLKNGKGWINTIDLEDRKKIWKKIGIPNKCIHFVKGNFWEMNGLFLPKQIDMAFLDSNHRIENVTKDLEMLFPNMSKKSVIIIHDTNYARGMGDELMKYFKEKQDWDYYENQTACGMGIAEKKK